ncbi:MAG: ABC transporter permease [Verrucomicrobiota bacterium]|nr:ABC transporter permease [Verrucomicrobiota bacterium]
MAHQNQFSPDSARARAGTGIFLGSLLILIALFSAEVWAGFGDLDQRLQTAISGLPGIGSILGLAMSIFHCHALTAIKVVFYAGSIIGLAIAARAGREARGVASWLNLPVCRAILALVLVFLLGVVFSAEGAFGIIGTHRDALRQASVFGLLACGMTLVIIGGGIDLGVGSVLALVSVTFSLMSIHWGWQPWVSVPACLLLGAMCGGLAGTITAGFRIQPFVATLAMMVFARGLAKTVSGGTKVSTAVRNPDGTFRYVDVPAVFRFIDSRILDGNLSVVTVIFVVCAVLTWILLARHRWGTHLYAIGGNEEAARLSGVPVTSTKILSYVASGLLAGVAGLCQAAQEQQGDPETGAGYELTAIAIVVIGGTTLTGGRGGIGLTLLGTLTIGYLEKILSINAVPEASRLMLTGVIIVAAVLAQRRKR